MDLRQPRKECQFIHWYLRPNNNTNDFATNTKTILSQKTNLCLYVYDLCHFAFRNAPLVHNIAQYCQHLFPTCSWSVWYMIRLCESWCVMSYIIVFFIDNYVVWLVLDWPFCDQLVHNIAQSCQHLFPTCRWRMWGQTPVLQQHQRVGSLERIQPWCFQLRQWNMRNSKDERYCKDER